MRHVNTNLGDIYQDIMKIMFGTPGGSSPDQSRGNDIGLWLCSYYSDEENKDKPLSRAYSDYFYKHK